MMSFEYGRFLSISYLSFIHDGYSMEYGGIVNVAYDYMMCQDFYLTLHKFIYQLFISSMLN